MRFAVPDAEIYSKPRGLAARILATVSKAIQFDLGPPSAWRRMGDMTAWYVYMVRCADDSLYTGVATDIAARVATHNAGKGAKYTRGRRPVILIYQEPQQDRGAALRRERAIKRLRPAAKLRLVESSGEAG